MTKEEAKKWANERGITGKIGSTYLYFNDEGKLVLYKPFWYGRPVQGYAHLANILTERRLKDEKMREATR